MLFIQGGGGGKGVVGGCIICGAQSGLSHGLPLCSEALWPAPASSSHAQ